MGMFDIKPVRIKSLKLPSARKMLPRKRDTQRMLGMRRIREPISAKLKKCVLARAKNVCEHADCNIKNSDIKLQMHHKNMNNDDNRLVNIIVLCPNCHWLKHKNEKKISTRDVMGREIYSKVVSSKRAKAIKTARKKKTIWELY